MDAVSAQVGGTGAGDNVATRAADPEPVPDPLLARVLALLEDQSREMASLREEVRQTKAQQAPFRPMQPPAGAKPRGGVWGNLDAALAGGPRRGWGERGVAALGGREIGSGSRHPGLEPG